MYCYPCVPCIYYAVAEISVISTPTGFGLSDGTVTATFTGSAGPFEVALYDVCAESTRVELDRRPSRGIGTHTFEGLAPGSYAVVVTDKFNCETCKVIEVEEDASIRISVTQNCGLNSCNRDNTGWSLEVISCQPVGGAITYNSNLKSIIEIREK